MRRWLLCLGVLRPVIHQGAALIEKRPALVGGFGLVLQLVRQGVFNDFPCVVRLLAGLVPERAAEAVHRHVGVAHSLQQLQHGHVGQALVA